MWCDICSNLFSTLNNVDHQLGVTIDVFIYAFLSLLCRFDHTRPQPEMESSIEIGR